MRFVVDLSTFRRGEMRFCSFIGRNRVLDYKNAWHGVSLFYGRVVVCFVKGEQP